MFQNWSSEWRVHGMSNTVGRHKSPVSMHTTLKCWTQGQKFHREKHQNGIKVVRSSTRQTNKPIRKAMTLKLWMNIIALLFIYSHQMQYSVRVE